MGSLKQCRVILLLLVFLLTGCTPRLDVYTVVQVNDDIFTVTDGKLLYSYDGELTSSRREYKEVTPIREISSYGTSYVLSHLELNKYTGELKDAAGYYNYLIANGFECTSMVYYDNYLDIKLSSNDVEEVRILYLGNSIVRIFYRNASNSNLFPPYINKEE